MYRLLYGLLTVVLVLWSVASAEAREPSARMVFTGDIMVHADQLEAAARPDGTHDFRPQFRSILPFLKGGLLVGNLETVLAGETRGYTGYPAFNSPDSLADALKEAGFQVLLLANNHILDRGTSGAERTCNLLTAMGFAVTGVFAPTRYAELYPEYARDFRRPLLLRIGDIRVGLFNAAYGVNMPIPPDTPDGLHINLLDKPRLAEDIDWLRKNGAEFIVGTFHWGPEYHTTPHKSQREIAEYCLELGTDLIVGTHPHVLQPVEIRQQDGKTRCIAWSLGNFISCQRTLPRERSCILQVDIGRKAPGGEPELRRVRVLPTWVEKTRRADGKPFIAVHPAAAAGLDVPGDASSDRSEALRAKLASINTEVLRFLGVERGPDADGFHTLYEAPGAAAPERTE